MKKNIKQKNIRNSEIGVSRSTSNGIIKIKNQKGYAILFTVIIVSAISVITAGLTNTAYKQLILSSLAKDSQSAFYQADTAGDCAIYADQINPSGIITTGGSWTCGGSDLIVGNISADGYTIYPEDEDSQNACFRIDVTKTILTEEELPPLPPSTPSWESGLTSWWKLDGDTTDSVGTNDGIAAGGPSLSTDCESGQCYSFDGNNDYIYTENQQNNPQDFTISAWFKTTYAEGYKIFGFETNQTGEGSISWDRMLYLGDDGLIYFGSFSGSGDVAISSTDLADGNWHHIVGVRNDATDTISLYVDGIFRDSTYNPNAEVYNGYWRIGAYANSWWPNSNDGYFHGNIDEVMLWDRALSPTEVQDLHEFFSPSAPGDWQLGLISWWNLDVDATDLIGGHDGTVEGGAEPTNTGCKNNGCYLFSDWGDKISVGVIPILGNKGSMSVWIKANDLSEYDYHCAFGRFWSSNHIGIRGGDYYFTGSWETDSDDWGYITSDVVADTNLHHIVLTYNGDLGDDNLKMYIDGSFNSSQYLRGDNDNNYEPWEIGTHGSGDETWGEYWDGTIDEVMLWDRDLSSTEVQELYNFFDAPDIVIRTTIKAKGYNICKKDNLRTVEREIEINYE